MKVGCMGLPFDEELCLATTGAGETLTVGTEALAAITWTAANVAANITEGACNDLADPTDKWHLCVSISGGPFLVQLETYNGVNIAVNSSEDATEGIALKVTIDGTIVFQAWVTNNGASQNVQYWNAPRTGDVGVGQASMPMYCGTSFAIHAAYKGDGFGSASTWVKIPLIRYKFVHPE